jgi:steroid delta-isomerase-like uncharacterized protein
MSTTSPDRVTARLRTVEEHIRLENLRDLDALMGTFGEAARYDVEPLGERYIGRDRVRAFYHGIFRILPDLRIDVRHCYCSDEAVILEVTINGTHSAEWMGFPATGKRLAFPLCAVYTFDDSDRLAGERIYFDRATILKQMGLPLIGMPA